MNELNNDVVTINDIARLSGVSKSTVSRFLNGGSVSNKTKQKIQTIIEETNYFPNSFAQSLKAKKNNLIGTIVPRLDSPSIVKSLAGMDQRLQETNYELLILNTYQTHEREIQAIETFVKQKVGGIILFATKIDEDYFNILKNVTIPVIVIGQKIDTLHNILYSDYQAGFATGQYIGENNHSDITYFGVTENDVAVGVNRKQGLIDALKEYDTKISFYKTTFKTQDAYQLALKKLPTIQSTYVACATDNIALGVLKAALELGIKVPDKLSISGFGGSSATDAVSPAITTMKYGYQEAGKVAIDSLINLLNNQELPREILIPTELVIKESTKKNK